MCRTLLRLLAVGLFVAPVWAGPRQWADDFATAASYDSNSLYAPCYGGAGPKYSLIEGLLGDIYGQRAWSGGGRFSFNTKSLSELTSSVGRKDFAFIGWYGTGIGCPGEPAQGQSTEYFTSPNICMYGATVFSRWQCEFPPPNGWDIRGPDGKPGVANVDDDANGVTDDWNETPAARATTVNDGFGNPNGTGFQAGLDNAPGVAGIDDDGNGVMDDVSETGWTGSDDSDDTQRQMPWVVLKTNVKDVKLFYLDFDAGSTADAFSLREILGATTNKVEWANEIVSYNYYRPNITYNWVICVAGHSCYGAQMWHNADMANPAETLGPIINTLHTGPNDQLYGFGYDVWGGGPPSGTEIHFKRQMIFRGNTNFSDTFWVVSGNPATYYPSPSSDFDGDKDVDGFDFLTFSNCYNGSNKPPLGACANGRADLDRDGDVDGFDFLTFSNCYNGSNKKPLSACFTANLTTCGS